MFLLIEHLRAAANTMVKYALFTLILEILLEKGAYDLLLGGRMSTHSKSVRYLFEIFITYLGDTAVQV